MNQTMQQYRILRGEFGKHIDLKRAQSERERRRRRKDRLQTLCVALGLIVAAFLLWMPTCDGDIVLGTLLAFGFLVVLRMWINLPRRRA